MFDKRLVIVAGKGGVGKSAVAAGLAIAAHREGRKVLAISMVGTGGGLASHLGSQPLEFAPFEVQPGLHASMVDRSKALLEYLQIQVGLPPFVAFGPIARAFDALASAAPALREILTMGKVLYEVRRQEWDLVVADGPPTGQIGSFLRAPKSITELVSTGRLREQAAWMGDLLANPEESTLVVVTIPEELPTSETEETLAWLNREQVVDDVRVVANRVLPRLEVDGVPGGRAGEAATLHIHIQAEQRRWLDRLPPTAMLPYLFGIRTPAEVASLLADEMERW